MKTPNHVWRHAWLGTLALLMLGSCIQLRPISLYDGVEQEPVAALPADIEKIVSSTLFQEDTLNVWGIFEAPCKNLKLTDEVAYSGSKALDLQWNKSGCEFVGFGMGWDDWAGKDLEPIMQHAAFQMYVRTKKGKAFGLPMVFTLEDYSGVMAFCYTANKYFERYALDEEWQKVQVPLKAFDDEGEGIDYTNIKQLQVELQQAGDIYVDDITLVYYEEPKEEPWMVEPKYPDPTELPQTLFTDEFVNNNGWGLVSKKCQSVELSNNAYSGSKSVHAKWDNREEACQTLNQFGVSWARWNPVDITPMVDNAVLTFYIKAANPEALKFQILLEDFDRNKGGVNWRMEWAQKDKNGWYKAEIPLAAFLKGEIQQQAAAALAATGATTDDFTQGFNSKTVKTLMFSLEGQGEMWIDQMSWESK
jgi:hypothetical protein